MLLMVGATIFFYILFYQTSRDHWLPFFSYHSSRNTTIFQPPSPCIRIFVTGSVTYVSSLLFTWPYQKLKGNPLKFSVTGTTFSLTYRHSLFAFSTWYFPSTAAAHHDDLLYLFNVSYNFPPIPLSDSEDSQMVDKMTAIFYNFMRYGWDLQIIIT